LVDGAILIAPRAGVRALIEWAVDLWPYVNGKAIMSNVDLLSLDASDMLDVIHYLFEEDIMVSSEEEEQFKSDTREALYNVFYEKPYKYKTKKSSSANNVFGADGEMYEDLQPFDPTNESASMQAPASFGVGIDGPLN
jgi:hypothetical protein